MPGIAKESSLDAVARTCREVSERCTSIRIDQTALQQFVAGLSVPEIKLAVAPVVFPLQFPSIEAHVTCIALWRMLDFGSAYDPVLLRHTKRTAQETMQYGVLSMLISLDKVDCYFMKTFSMVELQAYFRLDPSEEHQVAPGITVSRCGGPLLPFCQLIINAMNETGRILEERHHRTLGDYIVSTVASLRSSGKPGVASGLVADLASTLPTFSDQAMYEQSHEVSFARKAQRLVSDLHETLQEQDERFQFEDVDQISLDSGNAATAALCRSGVIQLPDDLSSVVGSLQDGEPGDGELALRAAVVTAGHDAARASGGAFSARELGYYLLSKAGDGDGPEGPQAYLTHGSAAY